MRKFKVINDLSNYYGLKIGDVVTLVEGSSEGDLYELPPRLHGKGHDGSLYDAHLNLKEPNYVYIISSDLEEVKDDNLRKLIKQLDARLDDMKAEINYKTWDWNEKKTIIAYNIVLIENQISKIKEELNE